MKVRRFDLVLGLEAADGSTSAPHLGLAYHVDEAYMSLCHSSISVLFVERQLHEGTAHVHCWCSFARHLDHTCSVGHNVVVAVHLGWHTVDDNQWDWRTTKTEKWSYKRLQWDCYKGSILTFWSCESNNHAAARVAFGPLGEKRWLNTLSF